MLRDGSAQRKRREPLRSPWLCVAPILLRVRCPVYGWPQAECFDDADDDWPPVETHMSAAASEGVPAPRAVPNRTESFLHSRHAVLITHGTLILLVTALFALLLLLPFWVAFFPAALVSHRVGIMLHEYVHGIPFKRYKDNLRVLSFFDGLLLFFGSMEVFRGTHLAHHRWLNTDDEPGSEDEAIGRPPNLLAGLLGKLQGVRHLGYLLESFQGKHPYVRLRRVAYGAALSGMWIAFWVLVGRPEMIWKIWALIVFNTMVPITLRGAVEHHSHPGDTGFSNEYRVVITLFNLNRHLHHHEAPTLPWYLLEYRTAEPLPRWSYFTYWYHLYVRRDFVRMKPKPPPRH